MHNITVDGEISRVTFWTGNANRFLIPQYATFAFSCSAASLSLINDLLV